MLLPSLIVCGAVPGAEGAVGRTGEGATSDDCGDAGSKFGACAGVCEGSVTDCTVGNVVTVEGAGAAIVLS